MLLLSVLSALNEEDHWTMVCTDGTTHAGVVKDLTASLAKRRIGCALTPAKVPSSTMKSSIADADVATTVPTHGHQPPVAEASTNGVRRRRLQSATIPQTLVQSVYYPNGNPECPCVDIFSSSVRNSGSIGSSSNATFNSSGPLGNGSTPRSLGTTEQLSLNNHTPPANASANCTMVRSSDGACFPAFFGSSGCVAYDDHVAPECSNVRGASRPNWCTKMWCYVDPRRCLRRHRTSVLFPSAMFRGRPISYSYRT
jgi:hypothetical protein